MDLDLIIYHQGQNMGTHPVHLDPTTRRLTLCDGPYWLHDKVGEARCNQIIERIFTDAAATPDPAHSGGRFDAILWRILPTGQDDTAMETAG